MNSRSKGIARIGLLAIIGSGVWIAGLVWTPRPFAAGTAGDPPQILKLAEDHRMRYQDRQALDLYEALLAGQPDNPEALYHAAYLHVRLGWISPEAGARRRHYQQAHDYAVRLSRLQPESYEAHLVLGAAKAKLVEFLGSGEKVRTARELENHARFLLRQRSDNPDVWYLFGWWHFQIARVPLTDRILAALLFGGLPAGASTDAAIECLQKAVALRPDYSVYRHDLGLFYERTGRPEEARAMYQAAAALAPRAPEDAIFIAKARRKLEASAQPGDQAPQPSVRR